MLAELELVKLNPAPPALFADMAGCNIDVCGVAGCKIDVCGVAGCNIDVCGAADFNIDVCGVLLGEESWRLELILDGGLLVD